MACSRRDVSKLASDASTRCEGESADGLLEEVQREHRLPLVLSLYENLVSLSLLDYSFSNDESRGIYGSVC